MIVKDHLHKVSRNILIFLRVFGMWPTENPSPIYILYGQTIVLVFSLIYTALMVIQLFNLRDMKNSTEALYMTLTEVALVIKILNFMIRIVEMQAMLRSAEEFLLEDEKEEKLLRSYVGKFFKISIFYYLAAFYASSSADVAAALGDSNDLPFSAWYPYFDWEHNNRHFWILFVYQAVGMFITAMVNVSLELFAAMLMTMNSFQMEVLGIRLRRLGFMDGEANNNPRFSSAELKEVHGGIIKYAKLHQGIIKYVEHFISIHYHMILL